MTTNGFLKSQIPLIPKKKDFFVFTASQHGLRSLSVQGCPEVNDWFLGRLHVFRETLQELNISHCPCVTVGGLAALQHLRYSSLV